MFTERAAATRRTSLKNGGALRALSAKLAALVLLGSWRLVAHGALAVVLVKQLSDAGRAPRALTWGKLACCATLLSAPALCVPAAGPDFPGVLRFSCAPNCLRGGFAGGSSAGWHTHEDRGAYVCLRGARTVAAATIAVAAVV